MDAEKIVLGLKMMALDLGNATSVRHKYLEYVEAGAAFIERTTKPLTLDECREILNANKYSDAEPGYWSEKHRWVVDGERLIYGYTSLKLFEATALARAFLLQGGAE